MNVVSQLRRLPAIVMWRASVALTIVMSATVLLPASNRAPDNESQPAGPNRAGYLVTIQVSQQSQQKAHGSSDQITIIFATRSVEGAKPPQPFFGDDIVQEFSFSAQDFVNDTLRFTRRVRDKSFVDAPYIRVVNHGSNGWEGDKIWLTVDGEEILRGMAMSPRKGSTATAGFQKFNPRQWRERSFWEIELQPFRRGGTRSGRSNGG